MATVTLLASDGLSSASPTITSAATITAVVGDWLLVAIAANNRAADGSSHWADNIDDSDGINTYITRVNVNYNPAGTNTGATVILVTAAVTDALTNATISMTWDTAAFGAGAYQIFRIRPGAGEGPITFVTADTSGSTGSATNHSAATVSVALGNMIFGAAAIETNISITGDSDTSNGSWSALSTDFYPNATDTLGMTSAVQWKTVTGTGNQSWTCSTTSAKDSARSYLVLHLASAAYSLAASGGAYNLSGTAATMRKSMAPMVAGAGSYALTGTAATFIYSGLTKTIAAAAGDYSLLGTDATLKYGYKLDATAPASYTLVGTDAVPFKTAAGGKTLPAGAGTYALTGTDATPIRVGPNLIAGAGSYSLTGTDASLLHAWRLVTGSCTNIILQSQTLDNAAWTGIRASVTANQAVAPDATTTADALVEDASNNSHVVFQNVTITSGKTYTFSFYAKAGVRTQAEVQLARDSFTAGTASAFDLTTGAAVGAPGGTYGTGVTYGSSGAIYAGNGWWRLWINATITSTTATASLDFINAGSGSYQGVNGTQAYYAWGAQLELGSTPSPYIPTTTTAVTVTTDSAGDYVLTGNIVGLNKSVGSKTLIAEAGSYALTGTDATPTTVALVNKTLAADAGSYALLGTDANLLHGWKVTGDVGSYALTGSAAVMVTAANKAILAEAGSYSLLGTDATMAISAAPLAVSPLHIGEWPIDKKKRRAREDARAKEQRARDRFRRAIDRLLEGLPPEFDEPADLDEALDTAVQASNLLYAMSAPIREINAVNELIDHIRQLRIAQPIAQLHLAQAYNQARRHLNAKGQEDIVMALLLGE